MITSEHDFINLEIEKALGNLPTGLKWTDISNLLSTKHLGEKVEIYGFFSGFSNPLSYLEHNVLDIYPELTFFELRSKISVADNNQCIIACSKKMPLYTSSSNYLRVFGKLKQLRIEKPITYQSNIRYIEAEDVEEVSYLAPQPPVSAHRLLKSVGELLNDYEVGTRLLCSLITSPDPTLGRKNINTPFVAFDKDPKHIIKKVKEEAIGRAVAGIKALLPPQVVDPTVQTPLSVRFITENETMGIFGEGANYFIVPKRRFKGAETYLTSSVAPLLIKTDQIEPFCEDAEFLSPEIYHSILWHRWKTKNLEPKKFDEKMGEKFLNELGNLNESQANIYLGMSTEGYYNSPDLRVRYGGAYLQGQSLGAIDHDPLLSLSMDEEILNELLILQNDNEKKDLFRKGYQLQHLSKDHRIITRIAKDLIRSGELWFKRETVEELAKNEGLTWSSVDAAFKENIFVLRVGGCYTLHPKFRE